MRRGVKAMVRVSSLGGVLLATGLGCGGGGTPTATERLWVSTIPTKPTKELTAFVTMRGSSSDRYLGAFFRGTLYRGGHEVFEWEDKGKDHARVKFLQDGRRVDLRLSTCKPTTGFDYCLEIKGDRAYAGTYQSRKRWVVRRPGRKRDAAAGLVTHALLELSEDDAELAEALDAAAEAAGVADE